MKVVETISEMQELSLSWKRQGLRVGVIPTMGALHEGHLSLIDLISPHVDKMVVTIFVNPTQFGAGEDLSKYPRTFEADKEGCQKHGVETIFFPSNEEMYSPSSSTWVEEANLTNGLCGSSRPEHFRGVTTVVAKLFNAVLPDVAVFGEKDFQQLQVLRRMTRDLNFPINIIGAPIVREGDGLAMSSRNRYLSSEERQSALTINESMRQAIQDIKSGKSLDAAINFIKSKISQSGGKVDYVKIVDSETLEELTQASESDMRLLVAAVYGPARLIDNMEV
ncbi:MAG: pantoate--beta-alanine ligase [Lentisphaeraceae bacterium]|nr:pantoate--beta-alanine ligase [Lentisphaeraceae bacterium]